MSPGRRRRSTPRSIKKMDVADVSRKLGVHKTTVYRWIDNGLLRAKEDKRWGVYTVTQGELKNFRKRFQR